MLEISRLTVEQLEQGCITDSRSPEISFQLASSRQNVTLKKARITVGDWTAETDTQILVPYKGKELRPFTRYTVRVTAEDDAGEKAQAETTFETGRMGTPWSAQWISDPQYRFTEKKVSPVPMMFRRKIRCAKKVKEAKICASALGIYELSVNGQKAGDRYFAPGFTSYRHEMQYQVYDVTGMLEEENTLTAVVAGGWAVGSFVFTRGNRHDADRQALLAEIRITYEDGSQEIIGTDESWEVTEEGPYRMADLYDGETYDATVDPEKISWRKAERVKLKFAPNLIADYGSPVRAHEEMKPVSVTERPDGALICDFGQNFAGVVRIRVRGTKGQRIVIRHAEILNRDGSLNVKFLRTAKATAQYICRGGAEEYSPRFTYMGFRYISVEGVRREKLEEICAYALYSDIEEIGEFTCSDERINRLQKNILWSSKSNFVEIPTDCPQRDERMGWTGDIAVFAPTACFNFRIGRFIRKWLLDVRAEQLPGGGIPNTVPAQGYGFPATMPAMAVDWWGDACATVPWAQYMAEGDIQVIREMYPVMKKYVKACRFWAGFGVGKRRYIWHTPSVLHFGDWVAPDVPKMSQWQKRSRWTATASLYNTSRLTAMAAELLGEKEDAAYFKELAQKTADAYISVFTDGKGKLKEEFQTAYVLPLWFKMFPSEVQRQAAANLAELVKASDYCIGTGFPGTPYILFALADNGQEETAFRMLTNTKCPSWLYEVESGATTIWERWDGLDENGECPISDDGTDMMISYNHYASGAVGAFLYERIAGIEAVEPGYRTFRIRPLPGGGITHAKGSTVTPYGKAVSDWRIEDGTFYLDIEVPAGTKCAVTLPDGTAAEYGSGRYHLSCPYTQEKTGGKL